MKTFLVTGSNRGIGLEYCRQLQARGEQVIAVCRTASPELEALGVRIEAGIELTAEAAIADEEEDFLSCLFDLPVLTCV